MKNLFRQGLAAINTGLHPFGLRLIRPLPPEDVFRGIAAGAEIFERVKSIAISTPQRIATLCDAVAYVAKAKVPGAFVECGVYRGGSSMAAALMMMHVNDLRDMHLYDTFEGMPTPTERDVDISSGRPELKVKEFFDRTGKTWTKGDEAEVRANMLSTGYDPQRLFYHRGLVEDTIPREAPERIAILRLDTDWYTSTKHELVNLWPRLSPGGVLIVDDYGQYAGARDAVDEYFEGAPVFLFRVDYTVRMAIKR